MMFFQTKEQVELTLIDFGGILKKTELQNDTNNDYRTKAYMAPELPHVKHSRLTNIYATGKALEKIATLLAFPQINKIKKKYNQYEASYQTISQISSQLSDKDAMLHITLSEALTKLNKHKTPIIAQAPKALNY